MWTSLFRLLSFLLTVHENSYVFQENTKHKDERDNKIGVDSFDVGNLNVEKYWQIIHLSLLGTPVTWTQLNDLALHISSCTSVDTVPARWSVGHGFHSCWEHRIFLCPTLVSCWSIHISHFITELKKFTVFIHSSLALKLYHCHQQSEKLINIVTLCPEARELCRQIVLGVRVILCPSPNFVHI